MFNYLYKITNLLNNNFYYGIHSTNNLDDGYMGSGKELKRAYEKYGIENFKKEILEFRNTREEISELEKEIVTEEIINNPNCYNIKLGGEDGWTTMGFEKIHSIFENIKHQQGIKNSQFGTCWINNGKENKKIKKDKLNEYLSTGWNKGRLINYRPLIIDNLTVNEVKIDIENGLSDLEISKKYEVAVHIIKYFIRKNNLKRPKTDKCWVNKNNKNKFIKKSDLNKYLNSGWVEGMLFHTDIKRCWMNKGGKNIKVNISELNDYLNNGWIKGRII